MVVSRREVPIAYSTRCGNPNDWIIPIEPAKKNGSTDCGPCRSMVVCSPSATRSSASSHDTRANRPSPFAPVRTIGCSSRSPFRWSR